MVWGFKSNNLLCKNIFKSDVIFLEEEIQFQKYYIEALHQLLTEIMGSELPFIGKHMIIGIDFGQTIPIVKREIQANQFRMSINKYFLWKKLTLQVNCK